MELQVRKDNNKNNNNNDNNNNNNLILSNFFNIVQAKSRKKNYWNLLTIHFD